MKKMRWIFRWKLKEFIACLEGIPDGGAECFPFELIEELKEEYV